MALQKEQALSTDVLNTVQGVLICLEADQVLDLHVQTRMWRLCFVHVGTPTEARHESLDNH